MREKAAAQNCDIPPGFTHPLSEFQKKRHQTGQLGSHFSLFLFVFLKRNLLSFHAQKNITSSDHPGTARTQRWCRGLKRGFPRAVLQAALSQVSPTWAKLKPQAHSTVYFCDEPKILGVLREQTHLAERCHFASPFWPSACASNHSFWSLCPWEQHLGTMSFWRETPFLTLIAARPLHPPKIIKQWDSRHSILRSEMNGKEWKN